MPAPPTVAPAATCPDLVRSGRITEALEQLAGLPDPKPADLAVSLECRLARGEMDLAIRLGERLAPTKDAHATLALGELAAATGRDDDAVTLFRAVGEIADDPLTLPWRAGVALGLMRTGGRREAAELAITHLALTRASGSAYAVAGALRTAATCLMVDRADRLREAHDLARDRFDRLAAQVATDLAGLIALTTAAEVERAEAVTLLRAAEEYADTEDLWPLHTRVRRLLERFGETPHTPRAEIIARLTESELRVARLAALGGTNRAIASDVGVTVKAVEWHLSHAYRKLGVRGRAELPRALRLA
jgi:DNA-binding NarL/FixJ family response regulator